MFVYGLFIRSRNPKQHSDFCIWACNEVTNTPSTYVLVFPSILVSIFLLLPLDCQTLIFLPYSPEEGVSPPHSFLFENIFSNLPSPSNQRQAKWLLTVLVSGQASFLIRWLIIALGIC